MGLGSYCSKHGPEYAALTREYKILSAKNEALDPGKLSRSEIRALYRSEAKRVIKANKLYVMSLEAEYDARTMQHVRFFGEVDPGHIKWLEILRGKQRRALAQLKLFDEAGFDVGPSRAVKESAIFNFTPVHSFRRKAPEASLIPDLFILVPCIIVLGVLVSVLSPEAWATLWAFSQRVISWLPTILQYAIVSPVRWLWSLTIPTIRALWSLTVILCTTAWRVGVFASDLLSGMIQIEGAGDPSRW
ncbi:uncharacterized protein TRAVEDRAFT_22674 [Trametes versicolor FP-101664 SS1]|uniref:uncharacterized protein n=1 Tax=Trametes versicolor (strain FP-101664) TaxID=717944 RepID=UPI0004621591|nr:uncharacterized protein TRAVEDRAFT_22674 [Trametes versicolor FP-101664 SS1]EIW54789.1 hypothetical protein TRAVEDRAFT_22674 [Trametes versicolor FP-101664 SS1]